MLESTHKKKKKNFWVEREGLVNHNRPLIRAVIWWLWFSMTAEAGEASSQAGKALRLVVSKTRIHMIHLINFLCVHCLQPPTHPPSIRSSSFPTPTPFSHRWILNLSLIFNFQITTVHFSPSVTWLWHSVTAYGMAQLLLLLSFFHLLPVCPTVHYAWQNHYLHMWCKYRIELLAIYSETSYLDS